MNNFKNTIQEDSNKGFRNVSFLEFFNKIKNETNFSLDYLRDINESVKNSKRELIKKEELLTLKANELNQLKLENKEIEEFQNNQLIGTDSNNYLIDKYQEEISILTKENNQNKKNVCIVLILSLKIHRDHYIN